MERDQAKRAPLNGLKIKRRHSVNRMQAERENLLAEVALLRIRGGTSKFTDNAQKLLSRFWSIAGLDAREDLLKSVEWLILLERRRQAQLVTDGCYSSRAP